jgi:hypothetical protein
MTSFPNTAQEVRRKREREEEEARRQAALMMSPEYKQNVRAVEDFTKSLLSRPEPEQEQPLIDVVRQDPNRLRQLRNIATSLDEEDSAPESPQPVSTSMSDDGAITSYSDPSFEITNPLDETQNVRLGGSADPMTGTVYPDFDVNMSPEAMGEAASLSQDYRASLRGLVDLAVDSGLQGDLYNQFAEAEQALDLDRSAFRDTVAGQKQYRQALQQARQRYGTLARRVLMKKPEIFAARDRAGLLSQRDTESAATEIQKIADGLISQSMGNEFAAPMTPEQAYASAIAQYNEQQSIQQRLRTQLQSGQLDPQAFAVEQEQAGQPFAAIRPEQFALAQQIIEQVPADLPYQLYMENGQARLSTGAGDFEAVAHPGSPVPVAIVRDEFEKSRAESAGVPYITPGNPNVVQNRIRLKPSRGDTTATRRGDFGIDAFNPQKSYQESVTSATEEFEDVFARVQDALRAPERQAKKRDSYNRLARLYLNNPGFTTARTDEQIANLPDPQYKPVIRDPEQVRGFSVFLQTALQQGDEQVARLVEQSGIDPEQPSLPQDESVQLDPVTQQALDLYNEMTVFPSRTGQDFQDIQIDDAGNMRRVTTPFGEEGQKGQKPSKAAFRLRFLLQRARELTYQQEQTAQEQTYLVNKLSGASVRQSIQGRSAAAYESTFNPATGAQMYVARDRSDNYNPEFELRPVPTANGVVSISDPSDLAHVAFDTPFVLASGGEPITFSVEELNDVLQKATTGASVGNFSRAFYNNPENVERAFVAIANYLIQDKMPAGFFRTNQQALEPAFELLRRLGYKDNPGLN